MTALQLVFNSVLLPPGPYHHISTDPKLLRSAGSGTEDIY
jgi:hypothetical protein